MYLLFIAGILAVILGLVHTGLGETFIFKGWRETSPNIARRHRNIIWASWHLVTICCLAFGIILLAIGAGVEDLISLILYIIAAAFLLSSGLVLLATRGKHSGWIVLLIIALLTAIFN